MAFHTLTLTSPSHSLKITGEIGTVRQELHEFSKPILQTYLHLPPAVLPSCDDGKVVPDPKYSKPFYLYYRSCPFSLYPSAGMPPCYPIFNLSFTTNLILIICDSISMLISSYFL